MNLEGAAAGAGLPVPPPLEEEEREANLARAAASAGSSSARKNGEEEGLTLSSKISSLGIWMKTEHSGILNWELLVNILDISLSVELFWLWRSETWSKGELHFSQDCWLDQDLEIGRVGSSIPVIGNMTTVHDLSEKISKIGIWNLLIVGKIVMKNISADSKITIVEVVLS